MRGARLLRKLKEGVSSAEAVTVSSLTVAEKGLLCKVTERLDPTQKKKSSPDLVLKEKGVCCVWAEKK